MSKERRDRIYQYAKYYHLTKSISDYLDAIKNNLGAEFLDEAEVAWETIDQWEGDVNPR